nr:MAG TPA: hypothetical protein [Caudoviricetes sp.]
MLLHITYTPVKRGVGIFDQKTLLKEDRIVYTILS